MQLNSHNVKYLYTSLLSLVAVSCNVDSKKSKSEKFDGSNFVTVSEKNYNKNYDLSTEINENKVVKLEGIKNSEKLQELLFKVSPIALNDSESSDKETDVYLYKNNENNLSLISASSNNKDTEKEVGKMIYAELNSENKSDTEENDQPLDKSSVTVTIFEENLSCFMPKLSKDDSQLIDYCDKKANVKLHFKVDMFGSRAGEFIPKENPSQKIRTEDGKFITFSISPSERGGPGWHIKNSIKQEKIKYGDRISPVANKYFFEINSDSNSGKTLENQVHIANTFPTNLNPKTTFSETIGYNSGISGGLKLGSKAEFKPAVSPATGLSLGEVEANVGLELGANILRTRSRTIQFETYEYTVENNSNGNKAMWIWDAKIPENICTYLTGFDTKNCDFSTLPWNTRWASNINKFSAISHKSFTPAFLATYRTSTRNKGITSFEISTKAQTAAIFGEVSQLVIKKSYKLEVGTGEISVNPIVVSVNWNSPFFASEENIRLQKTNSLYATKCLAVNKATNVVSLADCDNTHEQIWGYDIELKLFKSRTGLNNLCLALQQDKSGQDVAVAEPCFANSEDKVVKNNQIWEFTTEGYIRSKEDPEQRVLDTNDNGELVLKVPNKLTPKFKAYDAKL
ncbi:leukocidin family pore-forming toxin [Pigmentibacter sp. JX0631]|uniref:ricin-type beta-trefoil lectin domain protein n=1 Tax=Pigmentibacter sp. JX0631 TaxID=2976982 RepID=UPI002468AFDA|nr:ricin-type beta-trefoil lectin domain protein [Pigmentibacter sp. JX0631]WGL60389.1 leukocidin family pore-forming toxin [Pigmentibacter sp. JX0631]